VPQVDFSVAETPGRLQVDPNQHPAASFILRLQGWDTISADEQAVIRDMLRPPTVVENRQDIIVEGARPQVSTLLVDGFAVRYKLLENGSRQITAVHVPGDFIDLHSFLLHQMDHGISTLTRCRIATVPHATLAEISRAHPHLSRLFWLMTLVDGAIHREWLVTMGRRMAVSHLAHLICELYCKLAVLNLAPDREFLLPATQADIADMMGLSAVHVNRSLQELRARGLVHWQGHTVKIEDWDGLKDLAEFDPTYLHQVREPR
jgi:CRP-like cAMP-binding protein